MTTASDPSDGKDGLSVYPVPSVAREPDFQSAAVQGAFQAFSARAGSQSSKPLNNTNGARAAAASAGYPSRQSSVSPPKGSTSAPGRPSRSRSARLPQVQQLVNDIEQLPGAERLSIYRKPSGASESQLSRSSSRAAARVASSNSPSQLRPATPLPVQKSGTNTIPPSALESDSLGSGKGPLPNHPNPTTSQPSRPVPSTPALPALEHEPTHEENIHNGRLRKHPLRPESSMLAAQVAAKKRAPLTPPSAPQLSKRNSTIIRNSGGDLSRDLYRGRSLNVLRNDRQGELPDGNNASHRRALDDFLSNSDERNLKGDSSATLDVSATMVNLNRSTAQSGPQIPPAASAKYIDERTGLTEITLADAIVASSLASSRAASPARKPAPAPPPRRRSPVSRSLFRRHQSPDTALSRRGSPHRGMRQTLREYHSEDSADESAPRKHKHFMKHPNKHREGSRKRWKDKVTERERKRYEGVWAANKGMFLSTPVSTSSMDMTSETLPSEMVLDIVVRDIWSRSRLPTESLAEIWDLVDRQGNGTLSRDEFVVGLWLIDQKLKGRKLPLRVSPTLWASVRYARAAKIPQRL